MSRIQQLEPLTNLRTARRARLAARVLASTLLGMPLLLSGSPGDDSIPAEIISPAAVGRVVFPHLFHVEELGVECVECHHETRAATLETPHPEYLVDAQIACDSCHRGADSTAEPQSCGACHDQDGKATYGIVSAKVAIHGSCWACHEIGTGVEASSGCASCHEVTDEE